jgi:hypothetical protein
MVYILLTDGWTVMDGQSSAKIQWWWTYMYTSSSSSRYAVCTLKVGSNTSPAIPVFSRNNTVRLAVACPSCCTLSVLLYPVRLAVPCPSCCTLSVLLYPVRLAVPCPSCCTLSVLLSLDDFLIFFVHFWAGLPLALVPSTFSNWLDLTWLIA